MTTFAVLATGPSMSQAIADYVRGKCGVIAVSNAYELAPWADALVSNDAKWWRAHPQALQFLGRKFCGVLLKGTEHLKPQGIFRPGTNSGLQGMRVAAMLGADRILLLGFDLHGTHYFGPHPSPLKNSSPADYRRMLMQFARWDLPVEVINCTPESSLKCFPMGNLQSLL